MAIDLRCLCSELDPGSIDDQRVALLVGPDRHEAHQPFISTKSAADVSGEIVKFSDGDPLCKVNLWRDPVRFHLPHIVVPFR